MRSDRDRRRPHRIDALLLEGVTNPCVRSIGSEGRRQLIDGHALAIGLRPSVEQRREKRT
jgi:hypothetical protein